MSDRELLEAAAKAAGFVGYEYEDTPFGDGMVKEFDPPGEDHGGRTHYWNPLTDDGDALKLAVKLNLHVAIEAECCGCITASWDFDEAGTAKREVVEEAPVGGDDYAATRRAIVRAAAQIGATA